MYIFCMYFPQSVVNSALKKAEVFDEMEVIDSFFMVYAFFVLLETFLSASHL